MTVSTLSPDLCSWTKGTVCHVVREIWASESHLSLALPRVLPSFPVMSVDEDDVVYLIFTDVDVAVDGRIQEFKMQYLLRVDMQQNKPVRFLDVELGGADIPDKFLDPDFCGIDTSSDHRCHHGLNPARKIVKSLISEENIKFSREREMQLVEVD
ncbi:hypothetical protein D1007_25435 [Hordeum vulgare]|nr:hypothetical protein D1007_25435 [Hordeum vulgare]